VAKLALDTSRTGATTVVALTGELDLAGAAALEEELSGAPEGAIVLDLRGVEFMDSTGLRAIVVAALDAERAGGSLALVPGPEPVMRVFDITRMRERLTFVDPPEPAA
jgi:anti-sigma B factor antagonist